MTNATHTEVGNAVRLTERYGKRMRYVTEAKKWIIWDGHRWKYDDTGRVVQWAIDTVSAFFKTGNIEDRKWAAKSLSNANLTASMALRD